MSVPVTLADMKLSPATGGITARRPWDLDTRPVIVRNYSDEEADILVVDYNINREDLLPSEKAKAYKLKLDAMKRQGQRTDLTSRQLGTKLRADEILAEKAEDLSLIHI